MCSSPRSYPRFCLACKDYTINKSTIHHTVKIGETEVVIPDLHANVCQCGVVLFDLETDRQIWDAGVRAGVYEGNYLDSTSLA